MAIRMMISKEKAEALNFQDIEIVRNYPGHEEGRICHEYNCPADKRYGTNSLRTPEEYQNHFYKPCTECESHRMEPLYMHTTHKGLVLECRERNGRDDSDFYAIVWNPETQQTEQVEYATTRGWTYPNSAQEDATPETLEGYRAFQKRCHEAAVKREKEADAKIPRLGRTVEVFKGRKVPVGTVGVVCWFGRDEYQQDYSSRYRNPYAQILSQAELFEPRLYRIGIQLPDGTKVFTSASNVKVIEV